MRLGAQPFLWKWVLFAWDWKMIAISKAEHLPSFWNRGPGGLGNGLMSRVTRPVTRASLNEPTFHIFPYETWWTLYMRNKKLARLKKVTRLAGPPFCNGWVTLIWFAQPGQLGLKLGQGETSRACASTVNRATDFQWHSRARGYFSSFTCQQSAIWPIRSWYQNLVIMNGQHQNKVSRLPRLFFSSPRPRSSIFFFDPLQLEACSQASKQWNSLAQRLIYITKNLSFAF